MILACPRHCSAGGVLLLRAPVLVTEADANTLRGFDDLRGSADLRGMRLRGSDARGPDDHAVAAWSSFVTAGEERLVPVDQLQPWQDAPEPLRTMIAIMRGPLGYTSDSDDDTAQRN